MIHYPIRYRFDKPVVAIKVRDDPLDPNLIQPGDTLIGSRPVNLAAEVRARGGHYRHLSRVYEQTLGTGLFAEGSNALHGIHQQQFTQPLARLVVVDLRQPVVEFRSLALEALPIMTAS